MAFIGGFFKKTKHQRFEYRPRYWDPDREDLEQRIKTAQGTADNSSPEAVKQRISNNLRRSYKSSSISQRSSSKRSSFMLLAIIGALAMLAYYFLTVYLPVLERMLGTGNG